MAYNQRFRTISKTKHIYSIFLTKT